MKCFILSVLALVTAGLLLQGCGKAPSDAEAAAAEVAAELSAVKKAAVDGFNQAMVDTMKGAVEKLAPEGPELLQLANFQIGKPAGWKTYRSVALLNTRGNTLILFPESTPGSVTDGWTVAVTISEVERTATRLYDLHTYELSVMQLTGHNVVDYFVDNNDGLYSYMYRWHATVGKKPSIGFRRLMIADGKVFIVEGFVSEKLYPEYEETLLSVIASFVPGGPGKATPPPMPRP